MFCFHEFHFQFVAQLIENEQKGIFFQNPGIGMVLHCQDNKME